jgi:transcriptional regulator with AAA-type ATPase domain
LQPDRRSPPSSNEPIALAPSMIEAVTRAHAFAPAATPVVLYGESGSGKTFFARCIHDLSQRPGGFHAFSVGTVAPQLAADQLFGHVKGAYTDARGVRPGRIATAGGGTLLLDDLQTADLGLQKQMLQMLDSKTYSPVGSDRVLVVACRIIFAMTEVHPLRERREEIPPFERVESRHDARWTVTRV